MLNLMEVATALEQGMILESDDGTKYVAQENMCGGKYCCWADYEGSWGPVKLTNDINEAIAYVS